MKRLIHRSITVICVTHLSYFYFQHFSYEPRPKMMLTEIEKYDWKLSFKLMGSKCRQFMF